MFDSFELFDCKKDIVSSAQKVLLIIQYRDAVDVKFWYSSSRKQMKVILHHPVKLILKQFLYIDYQSQL